MQKALVWADARLDFIEKILIFIVFMALVVTLFSQVAARFVFETPLDFTGELSRVLLVWLVFLGAARAMATAEHFVVDAVIALLPRLLANVISCLVDAACLAFMFAVCWISYRTSVGGASEIMPAMEVSRIVQTLAMPVGFTLMLVHSVSLLLKRSHIGAGGAVESRAEDLADTESKRSQ